MLPDRVSNPGPLTYESGALPIALCGPASFRNDLVQVVLSFVRLTRSLVEDSFSLTVLTKSGGVIFFAEKL